jgi:prepilin-type N-terminal cleavage/methylation domain-containing protein/prepilin-type processing-associated H-X9-DG protein
MAGHMLSAMYGVIIMYPPPSTFQQKRGFTLIELLVVISIIALLIGILLPALASARTAARNVKDQTQLKQMGIAMEVYHNTYKGSYFPVHLPAGSTATPPEHVEWHELLINEVPEMDGEILRSPLDPFATFEVDHGAEGMEPIISYAINGYFEVIGANIRNMHKPTEVLIFAHRSDYLHETETLLTNPVNHDDVHFAFHGWEDGWWEDVSTKRALGGSNYAYCDGHVTSMKEDQLTNEMARPGDAFAEAEEE